MRVVVMGRHYETNRHSSKLPRRSAEIEMSQGALFAFGCVIFFIVATGGFLFAMMSVHETADRSREATG